MFLGYVMTEEEEKLEKERLAKEKEEEEKVEIDPTIKALQNDPDGIIGLRDQKRKANAEAKELRLELQKLKASEAERDQEKLKKDGEFEKLSEKLTLENATKAEKFRVRMIEKELQVEAINLKIRNKNDVKLASMDGVDFNDDSLEVTGAKEAIEKLKETSPYLFHDGEEDDEDDNGNKPAHETVKGKLKQNLKKFDVEKTNTRERFALPFKEK